MILLIYQTQEYTSVFSPQFYCWLKLYPRLFVIATRCPPLSSPANGGVSCTSHRDIGSLCFYSCLADYQLTGDSTLRTCTLSENEADWTGSEPNCIRELLPNFSHTINTYIHTKCLLFKIQYDSQFIQETFSQDYILSWCLQCQFWMQIW